MFVNPSTLQQYEIRSSRQKKNNSNFEAMRYIYIELEFKEVDNYSN